MISFQIPCIPIPQGRHRTCRTTTGIRTYDAPASATFKQLFALQAAQFLPKTPLAGPLRVALTFWVPKARSRPKREAYPAHKPDLDNLVKSVLDALRGLAWRDDAQIVVLEAAKYYAAGTPGVEVVVDTEDPALTVGTGTSGYD